MTDGGSAAKRQKSNHWGAKGKKGDNKSKYRSQAASSAGRGAISASGLQSGDVGIFVSSDKGKEKACLREMEDLLSQVLGLDEDDDHEEEGKRQGEEGEGDQRAVDDKVDGAQNGEKSEKPSTSDGTHPEPISQSKLESGCGIEDEIQRELAEMAGNDIVGAKRKRGIGRADDRQHQDDSTSSKRPRLGLVTLDIPCVSFVRFPLSTDHDPVKVVKKLCQDAKAHPERQRCRFVKRLTPLSKVRKVMSGGIEDLCGSILPGVFSSGEGSRGWKYAVRVTVRNNNQVVKEDIIKTVAGEIRRLGLDSDDEQGSDVHSRHKVDLKGYEKLVLVEVYRNVVGMAVVDDEWESLRRFNLAEIYADGRTALDALAVKPVNKGKQDTHERNVAHVALEEVFEQPTATAAVETRSSEAAAPPAT